MAYRSGTYIAFHAAGTTDPTASDMKYYNTIRMWSASKKVNFTLVNSHEKTSAVRDSSTRQTLRRALVTRLSNSRNMVLILTRSTKNDTDWVPFEIEQAVDTCKIPIIAAYPDYKSILNPAALSEYWPHSLLTRITYGTARVIHVPFRQAPIVDAIEYMDVFNRDYPTDGYGYYNRETQVGWGLISP